MKKLVLAAAIMMLVPFSAFALDTMNDDALDKMTAQEGVTITFDNVVITQQAADTAWYDSDGLHVATASGGRVFIDQSGSTETTITGNLEIDVATAVGIHNVGGNLVNGNIVGGTDIASGTSFVRIGLPSVSQVAAAKSITISMDGDMTALLDTADFAAPVATINPLGTMIQDGGTSTISGAVYIYAH